MNGLRTRLQMRDAITPDERVRRACDTDLAAMFATEREREIEPTWAQVAVVWAIVICLSVGVWL